MTTITTHNEHTMNPNTYKVVLEETQHIHVTIQADSPETAIEQVNSYWTGTSDYEQETYPIIEQKDGPSLFMGFETLNVTPLIWET